MKAGTVLLASEIPVFKEIYKGHALYFNQLDFSSIAKTMKDVLELTSLEREKIIKSAQEFVKCYSWDKMARQTIKVYEEIFKTKSSDSIR
jgi:glycosyltransferase involved in cell wall biosynthesis